MLGEDSQEYYDKFVPGADIGPGWGSAVRRISAVRLLSGVKKPEPVSQPPGENLI